MNIKNKSNNLKLELKLLNAMRRIREVELRIAKEYPKQQIRCPVHLSVGQEAPSAALSLVVKKKDYLVSTHRGHAHYLAKGGDLNAMICELYGKGTGCSKGKGGSMHLIDTSVNFMGTSAIVGNSIPTGTGLALASKLNESGQVSIINFGDGAIEEGAFYESLNFACTKQLPAVYICENNFYSVYSPLSVRQPEGRIISDIAKAIGCKSYKGDGNNALESYRLLSESFLYARSNSKPVFIELETYRSLEHCGPYEDDHLNYRPNKERNLWKGKDPIKLLENSLLDVDRQSYLSFIKEVHSEINTAFNEAETSPPPDTKSIYSNIYAD